MCMSKEVKSRLVKLEHSYKHGLHSRYIMCRRKSSPGWSNFHIIKHKVHICYILRVEKRSKFQTGQTLAFIKHLCHSRYILRVEGGQVQTGQTLAFQKHGLHSRYIMCIEGGQVQAGQTLAPRKHGVHIRYILRVEGGPESRASQNMAPKET